jgi:SAM-dependent methyltransferase
MFKGVDQAEQRDFWGKMAGRRNAGNPVVAAFAEQKVSFVQTCIEQDQSWGVIERILDVGSGDGYFTWPLGRWARCIALDFSTNMLRFNSADGAKVCGDSLGLPFRDGSFDLVFCSNLLHHVEDPLAAVSEMGRVSSRYVAISEPNRNNPLMFAFGLFKSAERGTLKFTRSCLAQLSAKAGLYLISLETMGLILPHKTPAQLLRVFKALDGRSPLAFYNVMVCRRDHR